MLLRLYRDDKLTTFLPYETKKSTGKVEYFFTGNFIHSITKIKNVNTRKEKANNT